MGKQKRRHFSSTALAGVVLLTSSIGCLAVAEGFARAFGLSKTWASYVASRQILLGNVTPERVGYTRVPGATFVGPRGRTYRINGQGFRDHEFSAEHVTGRRIAFLGDSVLEGFGVEASERMSEKLAARAGLEVLNFGVAGYATIDELAILERVLSFKPTDVLLQFCFNDVERNNLLAPLNDLTPEVDRKQVELSESARVGVKGFLQKHSALYLAVAERVAARRIKAGASSSAMLEPMLRIDDRTLQRTLTLLDEMNRRVAAAGAKLTVWYVPGEVEVIAEPSKTGPLFGGRLVAHLSRRGIRAFDMTPTLHREAMGDVYLDDCHLTPEGHELASGAIAAKL